MRHLVGRFLLLLAVGGLAGTVMAEEVRLVTTRYWRTGSFDPGTLGVALANVGQRDVQVTQVLVDDAPVFVWPTGQPQAAGPPRSAYEQAKLASAAKRVWWAKVEPAVLKPGGLALLRVKLSEPLARASKVEVEFGNGERVKAVLRPDDRGLVVASVSFSPALDRLHCFVANPGREALPIEGIEVDGTRLTKDVWPSSPTVAAGGKEVISAKLAAPLVPGSFHFLALRGPEGIVAIERVRAFSLFPLGVEVGPVPAGFGLDPDPAVARPKYLEEAVREIEPLPTTTRGIYLFECATHTYGSDWRRSAIEIFRRYDLAAKLNPELPACIHLCRTRPEDGYAVFGATADILRINPNVVTTFSQGPPQETPAQRAARLTGYARLAAAPRPVHSLVAVTEDQRDLTAAVTRKLAYSILGEGVKGFFYRYQGWADARQAELHAEIQRVNQELRRLIPFLTMADVFPLVAESPPGLSVYTLVNPDEGIVLVVVNEGDAAADANVDLRLAIPSWLTPRKLSLVTPDGLADVPVEGTALAAGKLTIARPAVAAAYVVHGTRRDSGVK